MLLKQIETRYTKPYMVNQIHPTRVITIVTPKSSHVFKLNEQQLKHFTERFEKRKKEVAFKDPKA